MDYSLNLFPWWHTFYQILNKLVDWTKELRKFLTRMTQIFQPGTFQQDFNFKKLALLTLAVMFLNPSIVNVSSCCLFGQVLSADQHYFLFCT